MILFWKAVVRGSGTETQEDQLGVLKSNKTQKGKVNEKQRMNWKENAKNARKKTIAAALKLPFQFLVTFSLPETFILDTGSTFRYCCLLYLLKNFYWLHWEICYGSEPDSSQAVYKGRGGLPLRMCSKPTSNTENHLKFFKWKKKTKNKKPNMQTFSLLWASRQAACSSEKKKIKKPKNFPVWNLWEQRRHSKVLAFRG